MKIGILTFWKTEDNYGQLLQCYALQTYLQSLGHETFWCVQRMVEIIVLHSSSN